MLNPAKLSHALRVAFAPLDMVFSTASSPDEIFLSSEEKALNALLLKDLLEKEAYVSSSGISLLSHPIKKQKKGKRQPKQRPPTKTMPGASATAEVKKIVVDTLSPTASELLIAQNSVGIDGSPREIESPESFVALPISSEPASFHAPTV